MLILCTPLQSHVTSRSIKSNYQRSLLTSPPVFSTSFHETWCSVTIRTPEHLSDWKVSIPTVPRVSWTPQHPVQSVARLIVESKRKHWRCRVNLLPKPCTWPSLCITAARAHSSGCQFTTSPLLLPSSNRIEHGARVSWTGCKSCYRSSSRSRRRKRAALCAGGRSVRCVVDAQSPPPQRSPHISSAYAPVIVFRVLWGRDAPGQWSVSSTAMRTFFSVSSAASFYCRSEFLTRHSLVHA